MTESLKILWVKTSPLHPLTRGGDLRSFHMLRCLHQRHHVVYAGMISGEVQREGAKQWPLYAAEAHWVEHREAPKATAGFYLGAAVNALTSKLPYAVTRFESEVWREKLVEVLRGQKFDLVVCDFLFPAASLPWEELRGRDAPALLLFQHNVESLIWQRRAEYASKWSRFYWRDQWQRMERFEREVSSRFDGIVAVSEEDAEIFRGRFGLEQVLGHVATGVDAGYFQAVPREVGHAPKVVFLGSMDWHANVDAVLHFVEHSWPLIRKEVADARFQIVGRDPLPVVRQLGENVPGVEVTGTVADIRPWLRQADVMVVPLRVGGGTRIKIFEAMAAEVPVVSTRIGAEGLPVEHGRDLLLADEVEPFAAEVVRLLQGAELGRELAAQALQRVVAHHSWEAVTAEFEEHCQQALRRAGR